MTRLAFIGKQRAGKDTAANYLSKKHGGLILKFADPLYEMMHNIYDIAGLPHNDKTKDRLLLQFLGTDWGRKTIDPNLWLNIMNKRLEKMFSKEELLAPISLFNDYQETNFFITDARFPNEVELLKKWKFKIIKVETCERIRIERGATSLNHESETALDNFASYDAVIDNTNDYDIFYQALDHIYEHFRSLSPLNH